MTTETTFNDITTNHSTTTRDRADVADLTQYRAIHEAMRVSNDQLVAALDELDPADTRRAAALHRWYGGYVEELRMHHHAEDDICFPALAERVPAFVEYSNTLADNHHRLDELIDALDAGLSRLAGGSGTETDRQRALAVAVELRDFLRDHLALEDADVIPLFERHFTAAEYEEMDRRIMKQLKPAQALFTAPWFIATIDPETAAKTLRAAPLPLKVVYYLGRRRYARLARRAFGASATRGAS